MGVDAREVWAQQLGFDIIDVFRGTELFISLPKPVAVNRTNYSTHGTSGQLATTLMVTLDDGGPFDRRDFGQSASVVLTFKDHRSPLPVP
jgi:hypothetical protein